MICSQDRLAELLQRIGWRGVLSRQEHIAILCAPYNGEDDHRRFERMVIDLYYRPRFAAEGRPS